MMGIQAYMRHIRGASVISRLRVSRRGGTGLDLGFEFRGSRGLGLRKSALRRAEGLLGFQN